MSIKILSHPGNGHTKGGNAKDQRWPKAKYTTDLQCRSLITQSVSHCISGGTTAHIGDHPSVNDYKRVHKTHFVIPYGFNLECLLVFR